LFVAKIKSEIKSMYETAFSSPVVDFTIIKDFLGKYSDATKDYKNVQDNFKEYTAGNLKTVLASVLKISENLFNTEIMTAALSIKRNLGNKKFPQQADTDRHGPGTCELSHHMTEISVGPAPHGDAKTLCSHCQSASTNKDNKMKCNSGCWYRLCIPCFKTMTKYTDLFLLSYFCEFK